jgi:hypothetical protein
MPKRIGFNLIDYKIRSIPVYRGTVITFCFILLAVLLSEIFYDLQSTRLEILVPMTAISFIIVFFAFKFPQSSVLRTGLAIMAYGMLEIHFLINPKIFHVVAYWFPLIPLAALINQGVRAAQIWTIIIATSHLFNSYFLAQTTGNSYEIIVYRSPFFVAETIFMMGILATSFSLYTLLGDAYKKMGEKNKELQDLRIVTEKKKDSLERYQQELIYLSRDQSLVGRGQDQLFFDICKVAAKTLRVSRVSIWLLENQGTCVVRKCVYQHDNANDEISIFERKHFSLYFHAIETKPFIIASQAREHRETRDFTDVYLRPLDIYSMLDCPIILDSKVLGIICCEHQHEIKVWGTEDALFVQSLADFISSSYKNERIKNLLEEVRRQNFDLTEKNKEIESMNDSLEEKVKQRTQELETRNTQLTEYAFINSHLLRAPLSRILGLSHLLTNEAVSINDSQVLDALIRSTNELDSIITKITEILYTGNNINRDDIKSIIDRNLNKDDQ